MCSLRKEDVAIGLKDVATEKELQILLKDELELPDFYGENWDAFWDTITGLVELPERIIFEHWSDLETTLPNEAILLKSILNDFNKEYPTMKSEIVYK